MQARSLRFHLLAVFFVCTAAAAAQDTATLTGTIRLDTSIYKVFKPRENILVQFRAEGFNALNHTEWNGLNPYVSTTNFIYSTGAHMPRVLQFGLRITF